MNEWVRIDKPGKYRLCIMSCRLSSDPPPEENNRQAVSHTATSAILDLEILPPDPAWAAEQLRAAVEAWGKGDEKAQAGTLRTLRYLGTEGAAKELVRLAATPSEEGSLYREVRFGLYGSPHRALVVKEMEAALEAPDRPILPGFLRVLTELALKMRQPALTRWPTDVDIRATNHYAERLHEAAAKYKAARRDVAREYILRLAKAMAAKTGRAKAVCVATLLSATASEAPAPDAAVAGLLTQVRSQAPLVFADLPCAQQQMLLGYHWNTIADPGLAPVLLKVFAEMPAGRTSYEEAERRNMLLMRIHQLSPDDGRKLILAELRRPTEELSTNYLHALLTLPDKTLPELDDLFCSQLVETRANHLDGMTVAARLLARYGTAAVLPRVKEIYGDLGGRWACDFQASLLAYFLRVEEPFGTERLREALSRRDKCPPGRNSYSHCYPTVLRDVSRLYTCPAMEKVALEFLDDADPEMAAGAAGFLEQHGTLAAKPALMKRLERWHHEWQGREEELQTTVVGGQKNQEQVSLEGSLVGALCVAQAWLLTPDEARRVQSLCVTENARITPLSAVKGPGEKVNLSICRMWDGELSGHIGDYVARSMESLKKKMGQYPKGTVFQVIPSRPVAPDRAKLLAELRAFAESQGMTLEDYKPDPGALYLGDD
jgi:hypothetical protein